MSGRPSLARPMRAPQLCTFSIVAADLDRKEWGIAVQSKFIAVGAAVPWAEAGVGALATQALANLAYGPEGLALLRKGTSAEDVVKKLTAADPERAHRQLGVVDAKGRAAAFTGEKCMTWAGHVVGEGFTCQGNILVGPDVVQGMARTFESTPGDLADRLLAALAVGQKNGGDRRGQQSASLYIVKPGGSYGGAIDRYIDVRVDDHPAPIEELERVFKIYDMTLLNREDPSTLVTLTTDLIGEVQTDLKALGLYFGHPNGKWDDATRAAFEQYLGIHNFENKARKDRKVWRSLLVHLHDSAEKARAGAARAQAPVYGALSSGPGTKAGARAAGLESQRPDSP